jgi:glutathione S-transferase
MFDLGDPDPAVVEEASGQFRRFAGVLNGDLKDRKYLVGDGLTIPDFAVAISFPLPTAPRSRSAIFPSWNADTTARPAWREPFPALVPA